jgi:hypothetical protein
MEVHHHSHTSGKKWTHYFWEFFMLFLAVTLGFFVENQREHLMEHKRESQYMQSFVEDMKNDTSEVNAIVPLRKTRETSIDSLIYLLNNKDPQQYSSSIYYHSRLLIRTYRFHSTQRTIQQLKSSGNMRLIRNKIAADIIDKYDYWSEMLQKDDKNREEEFMSIKPYLLKIQDALVLQSMIKGFDIIRPIGNRNLKSIEPSILKELSTALHYLRSSETGSIALLQDFHRIISGYIGQVEKEYHIK